MSGSGTKDAKRSYRSYLVNYEYSWKKTQIERQKSKFCFATCKYKLSEYDEWTASWLSYDGGSYHIFLSLQSLKIFVLLQLINVGPITNYNFVVLQRTTTNNKLEFCRSHFPLFIFPASSWFQKAKIARRMSLRNKKIWLIITLKGFLKQSVIEQSTNFLSFSFLTDCCMSVFSLYQSAGKFWKIEKI